MTAASVRGVYRPQLTYWLWPVLMVAFPILGVTQADVTDSELRWRAPLRRGTVPLDTLRRVRTIFVLYFVAVVIEADDGARVWFFGQPAMSRLVDHVRELAPQLEVGSRSLGRLSSRTHSYTRLV